MSLSNLLYCPRILQSQQSNRDLIEQKCTRLSTAQIKSRQCVFFLRPCGLHTGFANRTPPTRKSNEPMRHKIPMLWCTFNVLPPCTRFHSAVQSFVYILVPSGLVLNIPDGRESLYASVLRDEGAPGLQTQNQRVKAASHHTALGHDFACRVSRAWQEIFSYQHRASSMPCVCAGCIS